MDFPLTTLFTMMLPGILLVGFSIFFVFLAYCIFSNCDMKCCK